MKILDLIPSLAPAAGGTAEAVRQLVAARQGRVERQTVLSFDDPDTELPPLTGARHERLGSGAGRYGFRAGAVAAIRAHAATHDLVVVHGLWQYHSFAAWRALAGTPIPYAVFPHGMLDPWFNRVHPLKRLKKSLYWPWADRRVLRDAAAVCFTAEAELILARDSFAGYQAREAMLGFGIADPPAAEAAHDAAFAAAVPGLGQCRMLLFLGRLHAKKGCDLLVSAFSELAERHPDLRLVMAGPDPDGIGRELRRRHPCPSILWPGPLAGAAKWGALRRAEAFALFSHQENFGIAVVEALACGTPVLITHAVNIAPEIARADAGIVVSDDRAGAEGALHAWLDMEPSARARMGAAARACFLARFDLASVIGGHLEAFRRWIAGDRPPCRGA